jgi:hypothetical protein
LDAVDAIFARLSRDTPDQLRRVRKLGSTIKAEEEVASKARLARMWAEDEERRDELTRARIERTRQERRALALALGVGTILIVATIIAAIIATGSSRVPLY